MSNQPSFEATGLAPWSVTVKRYCDWMVANNKEPVIKLNGKNYEPC